MNSLHFGHSGVMDIAASPKHARSSDAGTHLARVRALLAAHVAPRGTTSGLGRPVLTAATVGAVVSLPAGTSMWRHVDRGGRELAPVASDGSRLVVHNVERAGGGFLVSDPAGKPRVPRGPALTLRVAAGDGEDLLVVVAGDMDTATR